MPGPPHAQRPRRRGLLAVLVLAQVLTVANANMIAVALPPLVRDLGASETQQQWIVDAYVLVFAALLVAGGVLGDRFGRRRSLLAGLVLFAAGSLACAIAPGPGTLIAARTLQGIAPPLVLPASLAIVAAAYDDRVARARALGVWGAGSGFGIAVGPLLGGAIVSGLGWRWVFALSAPAALALAAGVWRLMGDDRVGGHPTRFDLLGAVLVTGAMAGVVFGTIEGQDRGWTSAPVLGGFAAGLALLVALVLAERRHPAPLVDLALVRRPRFAAANLSGAAAMFAMLGTTVFLSAFLQSARGLTALQTGLALLPVGAAVAVVAPLAGRSAARVPPRVTMAAGLACAAVGAAVLSTIDPADGALDLLPGLLVLGAGVGAAFPAMTATAVAAAPAHQTGMASALHNASRQLGATLGVAVVGSIVFAAPSVAAGLHTAFLLITALLLTTAAFAARA